MLIQFRSYYNTSKDVVSLVYEPRTYHYYLSHILTIALLEDPLQVSWVFWRSVSYQVKLLESQNSSMAKSHSLLSACCNLTVKREVSVSVFILWHLRPEELLGAGAGVGFHGSENSLWLSVGLGGWTTVLLSWPGWIGTSAVTGLSRVLQVTAPGSEARIKSIFITSV